MKNKFYFNSKTQFENFGDAVISRELLKLAGTQGEIHILAKDTPENFLQIIDDKSYVKYKSSFIFVISILFFLLNTFQLLIFVISMSTYLFFGDFSALVVAKCFFLSNFITVLLVLLHLTWSKFDNLILLINVIFKFIPIWIGVFVLFYLLNMVGFSLISIVILIICYLLIFMYVYFLEKELRVYLLRFFGRV